MGDFDKVKLGDDRSSDDGVVGNVQVKLGKDTSTGNLRLPKHSQSYYCFFYPAVLHEGIETLSAKAVLALVTPSELNEGESVIRSYRMDSPDRVETMIKYLVRLYGYFWKYRNNLDIAFRRHKLDIMIYDELKKVKEGVYDNGI